jgi:hypothetical protein
MSPLTKVADVRTPTLVIHGAADLTCPVGQAQQGTRPAGARCADPAGCTRTPPTCSSCRTSVAAARLQPPVLDWAEQHAVRGGRARVDARTGSTVLAALAKRHRSPAPSSASCATRPVGRTSSSRRRTARSTWRRDPRRPRRRCSRSAPITKVWTATVVLQLVDEGWSSWTPRSSRSRPSPARRSRRHQERHHPAPAHPPAASTATSSPTRGAGTTAWRSTSTCWPRRRTTPRRDLVVLQPGFRSWAG